MTQTRRTTTRGPLRPSLVGRHRERNVLRDYLAEKGLVAVFVHGPAGVGKSAFLNALCADATTRGATVVRIDCRWFEPTERGFLDAIGRAIGRDTGDVEQTARGLAGLGDKVVLAVDTYELFRIADDWLRHAFLPGLPPGVRIVVAGREPPIATWSGASPWHEAIRSVRLGHLAESEALELLRAGGVSEQDARAVNRVARGHPLALQVAIMALREHPDLRAEESAIPRLIDELTGIYVDHLDAPTRRLIDAISVVRRATVPLVQAMLPAEPAEGSLERLARLPFVEHTSDGVRLHEAVQSAVATRLRSVDPAAHHRYTAAAWRQLRKDVREAPPAELWRYTADMLFLIENPVVREAFFPTTAHVYAVEPARDEDADAIRTIATRHEPPEGAGFLESWWRTLPNTFRVVRDRSGTVVGLSIVAVGDRVPARVAQQDPIVVAWRDHLLRHPLAQGQRVLFHRRWLDSEAGEAPCPVQAAAWLDVKRLYMEMRPHLGRLYTTAIDPTPYLDAMRTLGFVPFLAPVQVGDVAYHCANIDFGPGSVDGWLARLAAVELSLAEDDLLDASNRQVVVDDERIPLTHLEFALLRHLAEHEGRAVSRVELIEHVWGHTYAGGSNIVDVVVRSLRKKLGPRADMIETVRGIGYRFKRR